MKPILFLEWCERFDVKHSAEDEQDSVMSSPMEYIFYDNGAVADQESNFIIKADQVVRKTP